MPDRTSPSSPKTCTRHRILCFLSAASRKNIPSLASVRRAPGSWLVSHNRGPWPGGREFPQARDCYRRLRVHYASARVCTLFGCTVTHFDVSHQIVWYAFLVGVEHTIAAALIPSPLVDSTSLASRGQSSSAYPMVFDCVSAPP